MPTEAAWARLARRRLGAFSSEMVTKLSEGETAPARKPGAPAQLTYFQSMWLSVMGSVLRTVQDIPPLPEVGNWPQWYTFPCDLTHWETDVSCSTPTLLSHDTWVIPDTPKPIVTP